MSDLSEAQRRGRAMRSTEVAQGTVIGGNHGFSRYEFWEHRKVGSKVIPIKIARGNFRNDEEAIESFRQKFPEFTENPTEDMNRIEMRCYDKWKEL